MVTKHGGLLASTASKAATAAAIVKTAPVAAAGGAWDPNGTLPGLPGGTAHRDAAVVGGKRGMFNVAFKLSSGNSEIIRERRQAVINSREADRNNTMIRAGITKRAVDMVGANLRLQSMPNFGALGLSEEWAEKFGQEWENQFSLWGDDPRKLNDATRHSSFGSMMLETCRNTYGADGEAALIIRYDEARMRRYRGKFATFVEALDPDRISNPDGKPDSATLCQGLVLDEWGAYTGFHVAKYHPSDAARGPRSHQLVARETDRGRPVGVHWFPRFRAGAQRAMPAIIGSLRDVRMLDTFDQKTLEAAVKAAFMSIVIRTDKTTAEALAAIQGGAPTGNNAKAMEQQMDQRFALYEDFNAEGSAMPVMAPGDYIDVASASHASMNTDSFRFAFERKFASLLGLSYARFSNDYSKTSFASIRAEFIDAWRMTYADRYQFCSSVPALVALAHLEECIVRRKIILPAGAPDFYENLTEYAQCEFRGPGMGWVDPVKDVNGASLRIAGGFSNPIAEAAAQGSDFYDNVDATARAQAYAKKKLGAEIVYGDQPAPVVEDPNADDAAAVDENGDPIDPATGNSKPAKPAPAEDVPA